MTDERINSMATEAVGYANKSGLSYTKAVAKVAEDYGLNKNNIENVCHQVNHQVFKGEFEKDKLATFNIAKHETVVEILNRPVKVAQVVDIELDDVTIGDEEGEKLDAQLEKNAQDLAQEENMSDEEEIAQIPGLVDAAMKNMGTVNQNASERDQLYASLYNTIRASIQEGDTLSEIRDVLIDTWRDKVPQEDIERLLTHAVESLKREGYVDSNEEMEFGPVDKERDVNPEAKIVEIAKKILSANQASFKLGYAKYKVSEMLRDRSKMATVDEIDRQSREDLFSVMVKSAALGKIIREGAESAIRRTAGMGNYLNFTDDAKKLVGKALAGTAALALVGGGIEAARGGGKKIKASIVKKKLKKRYPELQEIDDELYDDVFDSIIAFNDDLLDAPFALQSIIKNHAKFNAMDASTVKTLSSAKKKQKSLAESMISAATKGTSSSFYKEDD